MNSCCAKAVLEEREALERVVEAARVVGFNCHLGTYGFDNLKEALASLDALRAAKGEK